jgi:energy-coupling factor transporter ATP-binding protein EcfA2
MEEPKETRVKQFMYPNDEGNTYVKDFAEGKIKVGLPIGCQAFDNHHRYKKGAFNVVLGHRNLGKTTLMVYHQAVMNVRYGLKSMIFSSENTVGQLKRDLIQFLAGYHITQIPPKTIDEMLWYVSQNFKFVNVEERWSAFELLNIASSNGFVESFDTLLIDPYNSLQVADGFRGMNRHDYDYEVASRMRVFTLRTGKTIYLPMHATTESLRRQHKDGDFAGHIAPPTDGDAEGGGKWANRCDDFLIFHRYPQSKTLWMDTHVMVNKVKDTATGGNPTKYGDSILFRYDVKSRGSKYICDPDGEAVDCMAEAKKHRKINDKLEQINF